MKRFILFTPIISPLLAINIYTYDSFITSYGAGGELKKMFLESNPKCEVNYQSFGDGGGLLNRVRFEGEKLKADLVIGLDNFNYKVVEKYFVKSSASNLADSKFGVFVPYDYSNYAFVYDSRKLKNPPKSLRELVEREDLKIIYQDPRTSAVGRGLVVWMSSVYGDGVSEAYKKLATHTLTITKGWSEAYGAFLKGQGDMVLSYGTSPLYHLLEEKNSNYKADFFKEGAIVQTELVAKTSRALKNPLDNSCSDAFIKLMLSEEAQKLLATRNVMLPVISGAQKDYDAFAKKLKSVKQIDTQNVDIQKLTAQWQDALL